jgi:hypothetical protein
MTDPRAALAEAIDYADEFANTTTDATDWVGTIANRLAERGVRLVTEADCIRAVRAVFGLSESEAAVETGETLFAALSREEMER